MTVEMCSAFCSNKKFKLFGLEYGRECYCSDSNTGPAAHPTDCSFPCPGDASQKCGAGNRLNVYENALYVARKPATLDTPYFGCFVDQGARALPDNLLGADDMTGAKCAAHCAGYEYFGVEYGRECWCGNNPPKLKAPEAECSFPCAGDDTELCGAGGRINVWGHPIPPPEEVGSYKHQGCYTDRGDARALSGKVVYDSLMTVEKCADACASYEWFGVEYASQCYCGTSLAATSQKVATTECSMRCGGDWNQLCGDANRLNVFYALGDKTGSNLEEVEGYTYKSCRTDSSTGVRSLTGAEYRSDAMTVQSCAAFCKAGEFAYFGVEFGNECYCGNELGGEVAPEEECGHLCLGDSSLWCGGPNRLNVYEAAAAPPQEEEEEEEEEEEDEECETTATTEAAATTTEVATTTDVPTITEAATTTDAPTTTDDIVTITIVAEEDPAPSTD